MRIVFAVRMKFLSMHDNKWHRHTTKWYKDLNEAWEEKEQYEKKYGKDWLESSSSAIHKNI